MGLRAANRPLLDENEYATATVVRAEFDKGVHTVKLSRDDIDTREYERFGLDLEVDGTAGVIKMQVFAGVNLNGPIDTVGRGKSAKAVYNRLTSICLGLGIVQPDELKGVIGPDLIERVQDDLLKLKGSRIKFKLGRVEGKSLSIPVPDTIKRAD